MPDILSLSISAISNGQAINIDQARALLKHLPHKLTTIIALAGIANSSKKTFTCAIINAKSGHCTEDCAFCSQSLYCSASISIHKLVPEEVIYKYACKLAEKGIDYMGIVTSGASPTPHDFEKICKAAERIKKDIGIKLCASLGILNDDQAKTLVQAGFSCYHHNLETSRSYYPSICTTHSYEQRKNTVIIAKNNGLRVCSGGLFGIGENWEQRLELYAELQKMETDSIPINFLIPISGTRLENAKGLKAAEGLAIIALMRLMHPDKDIVICGGHKRCLAEWDTSLFFAGANGLMVGDYLTTKGSPFEKDFEMLQMLGLRS